jgi:hypothetical protein
MDPMKEPQRKIEIQHDAQSISVVRLADNKTLIAVSRCDDPLVEKVADTLAVHGFPHEADQVRRIHYGRVGLVYSDSRKPRPAAR